LESSLVLLDMKPLEQGLIGQFAHTRFFHRPADQLQDRAGCGLDHCAAPFDRKLVSTY
jgi:hypothetical protein